VVLLAKRIKLNPHLITFTEVKAILFIHIKGNVLCSFDCAGGSSKLLLSFFFMKSGRCSAYALRRRKPHSSNRDGQLWLAPKEKEKKLTTNKLQTKKKKLGSNLEKK
jgi:hypothetical protein